MKKLNSKGFTLIELLAVITIMGILMLVAIPAISRTIENSRRDTFMDTAKAYTNAIKNAVAADELFIGDEAMSAKPTGCYYYQFTTKSGGVAIGTGADAYTVASTSASDLMEQGGKSSWGNADVTGAIRVNKSVVAGGRTSYTYDVLMVDAGGRGFETFIADTSLKRSNIKTSGIAVTDSDLAGYLTSAGASCERITAIQ